MCPEGLLTHAYVDIYILRLLSTSISETHVSTSEAHVAGLIRCAADICVGYTIHDTVLGWYNRMYCCVNWLVAFEP